MVNIKQMVIATFIASSAVSVSASTDVWVERENLMLIQQEINALKVLINHAKLKHVPSQRALFQYDVLIKDLDVINKGIEHHLSRPLEVQVSQVKEKPVGNGYTVIALPQQGRQ